MRGVNLAHRVEVLHNLAVRMFVNQLKEPNAGAVKRHDIRKYGSRLLAWIGVFCTIELVQVVYQY
jgi:hypothetical protein